VIVRDLRLDGLNGWWPEFGIHGKATTTLRHVPLGDGWGQISSYSIGINLP